MRGPYPRPRTSFPAAEAGKYPNEVVAGSAEEVGERSGLVAPTLLTGQFTAQTLLAASGGAATSGALRDPEDNGLTINGLWATAWVTGIAAVGSLARLVTYAVNGAPVQTELFVWVLIGTITGAFSACCAMLVGVTSAEQRLSQRADTSRK